MPSNKVYYTFARQNATLQLLTIRSSIDQGTLSLQGWEAKLRPYLNSKSLQMVWGDACKVRHTKWNTLPSGKKIQKIFDRIRNMDVKKELRAFSKQTLHPSVRALVDSMTNGVAVRTTAALPDISMSATPLTNFGGTNTAYAIQMRNQLFLQANQLRAAITARSAPAAATALVAKWCLPLAQYPVWSHPLRCLSRSQIERRSMPLAQRE